MRVASIGDHCTFSQRLRAWVTVSMDLIGHLVHGEVRNGAVQRGGADEGVDAVFLCVFHRLPAAVDVGEVCARQTTDAGVFAEFLAI